MASELLTAIRPSNATVVIAAPFTSALRLDPNFAGQLREPVDLLRVRDAPEARNLLQPGWDTSRRRVSTRRRFIPCACQPFAWSD